jgi:protein gp37
MVAKEEIEKQNLTTDDVMTREFVEPQQEVEWLSEWDEYPEEQPGENARIEQLRSIDARRWVSFEPLIEPIGKVALDHIDWAVVGGENASDRDRREMEHAWARDILAQCREQDVAFHFKQSSAATNESGTRLTVENEHGFYEQREIHEFPELPLITKQAREQIDNGVLT